MDIPDYSVTIKHDLLQSKTIILTISLTTYIRYEISLIMII